MQTAPAMLAPTRQRARRVTAAVTRRPARRVLIGVLILGAAVAGCSDDEPAADRVASAPTDTDAADASPSTEVPDSDVSTPGSTLVPATSPAATAVEQPPVGVDTLPPVSLGQPAEVESGLEFTLVAIRDVEVEPQEGSDDVQGPAVAVDIEVVNNGDDEVELEGFVVSATSSDTELSPIPGAYGERFPGVLAPGEAASATYGFRTGGETVTLLRLEDGLSHSIVIVVP